MTATVTAIRQAAGSSEQQPDGYTGSEACALAGVTYRQLDYWTRTGRLCPTGDAMPGSGHTRRYSRAEVDIASTGRRLLDAGFSLLSALYLARKVVESGSALRLADGLVVIDPAGVDG